MVRSCAEADAMMARLALTQMVSSDILEKGGAAERSRVAASSRGERRSAVVCDEIHGGKKSRAVKSREESR